MLGGSVFPQCQIQFHEISSRGRRWKKCAKPSASMVYSLNYQRFISGIKPAGNYDLKGVGGLTYKYMPLWIIDQKYVMISLFDKFILEKFFNYYIFINDN
jgi:hypothetical protein